MTWKDIKLSTLQKMFSAEGSSIPTDDSTKDYLAAMPYVANEGLAMICISKRPIIKSVDIDASSGEVVGAYSKVKLSNVAYDFFDFSGEVYYTDGETHVKTTNYFTEGQDVFYIKKDLPGTFTVYYKAYPEEITSETEDDYEIDVPRETLLVLPLYMASQLYKEDDNGIATSLRNEFEVAYDRLNRDKPSIVLENMDESGW